MNKDNSIEVTDASNLSNQIEFRLNEINKNKDYFDTEIQERKAMSKIVNTLLLLILLTRF